MFDAPVLRVVLLRCFGLAVGITLAAVAVGLVAYGIDQPLTWLTNGLTSIASWLTSDWAPGASMLLGGGLVALAILSALVMLPRRPAGLHRVDRTTNGTTWVDIPSVARTLERSLQDRVDSKIGVRAHRDRLKIVSPAPPEDPFAVADAVSDTARRELAALGLSDVEYVITMNPESRRQPRVQ